jgi:hypothetical protein
MGGGRTVERMSTMSDSVEAREYKRLVRSERDYVIDIEHRLRQGEITLEQAEAEREAVRRETAGLAQLVGMEAAA